MTLSDKAKEKLEHIKKVYIKESEVCMSELLANIEADGLSVEESFYLYIAAMEWSCGDVFYVRYDDACDLEEIEVEI